MGQFSDRIAVGDATPYDFAIDHGQRFIVVAFRWEDAGGTEILPAAAGSRDVTLSYPVSQLRGYVTGQIPGEGPETAITTPRLADPAVVTAFPDNAVRNIDTVDRSTTQCRLTSVQNVATPGATHYRYWVSAQQTRSLSAVS